MIIDTHLERKMLRKYFFIVGTIKDINDKYTKSIRDLNNLISKDKRIEKVMVPFGDGMTVCRKI